MFYFFGDGEIADIFDFVLAAGFAIELVLFIPGDAVTDMLMLLRFIGKLNRLIIIHTLHNI